MESFNRNEKQHKFNEIRGFIKEFIKNDNYTTIILNVGHEKPRNVAMVCRNDFFKKYDGNIIENDKVCVRYYLHSSSHLNKDGVTSWRTYANILDVFKDNA